MYSFTVYVKNNELYIDEKYHYFSNDILVECLNLETDHLKDWYSELLALHKKLLLKEAPEMDYLNSYDHNAQRAQLLMHKVDELIRSISFYRKVFSSQVLYSNKLFDCLNAAYSGWVRSESIEEDYPEDNQYGLSDITEDNYSFYNLHFIPDFLGLASTDVDLALSISNGNEQINELFSAYLIFIEDIFRVKNTFTIFLDEYINRKSRFLNEYELASVYEKFLKERKLKLRKENKLKNCSCMEIGHHIIKDPSGKNVLCESYTFHSLGSFLYFDLFNGIKYNCIPKRCNNCGKFFLLNGGKYSDYCESPLANDPPKTCRDIGARKKYDDKCKTDPIWLTYNRAYKAHYARYMKKKMSVAEFEKWSAYAVVLRTQALADEIGFEEYQKEIKK